MDESRVCSISVLAVLCFSFRRVCVLLVDSLLTKLEHVPVREYLLYVSNKALGGQGVPPPRDVFAIFDHDATV